MKTTPATDLTRADFDALNAAIASAWADYCAARNLPPHSSGRQRANRNWRRATVRAKARGLQVLLARRRDPARVVDPLGRFA